MASIQNLRLFGLLKARDLGEVRPIGPGVRPTGTVANTAYVAVSIKLTELPVWFMIKAFVPSEVIATFTGERPAFIVAKVL